MRSGQRSSAEWLTDGRKSCRTFSARCKLPIRQRAPLPGRRPGYQVDIAKARPGCAHWGENHRQVLSVHQGADLSQGSVELHALGDHCHEKKSIGLSPNGTSEQVLAVLSV